MIPQMIVAQWSVCSEALWYKAAKSQLIYLSQQTLGSSCINILLKANMRYKHSYHPYYSLAEQKIGYSLENKLTNLHLESHFCLFLYVWTIIEILFRR